MKKISIVIPCYNAAQYLDLCMEQILGQTIGIENIEIILVDDASTDNGATLNLIMEYEKKFPNEIIAIPLEQNLRQGGARNVGISYASGEYLMFCDADDWLALDAMEILYNTAKAENADVVEYRYRKVLSRTDIPKYTERGKDSYRIEMNEEVRRKLLTISMDEFSLGALPKMYRLSMIQDNHIRFAEHLIFEEPSFTLPVRLYEKIHVYEDMECYFYFFVPDSTMNGNWNDRKLDNLKVWVTLIGDLEKRGFLQKYYDELAYLFCGWGLYLSIRMLIGKGYIVTKSEVEFLKNAVLRLFPDIRQNPYLIEGTEESDMRLREILDTELTEEVVWKLNQEIKQEISR